MTLRPVRLLRLLLLLYCGPSAPAADAPPATRPVGAFEHDPKAGDDAIIGHGGPYFVPDEFGVPEEEAAAGTADLSFPEGLDESPPPTPPVPGVPAVPRIVDASTEAPLDPLRDDNVLLFRETRDDTSFVSHRGGFGLTTLGFGTGVHIGTSGGLSLQPRFGWNFLHGPLQPDLPPQLYDLSLEANFSRQINDLWSLHLMVAPTLATDFDNKDSDAFRLVAGGLIGLQLTPAARLVGGLTYLDRPDLPVVPIGGLRLLCDDFAVDLLIPQPRIAYRYDVDDDRTESWVYVGGALGGGSWAYEQENTGLHDVVGYRDFRLLIGHETKAREGIRNVIEAGYVFERRLKFDRGPGDFSPGDTWFIRLGVVY